MSTEYKVSRPIPGRGEIRGTDTNMVNHHTRIEFFDALANSWSSSELQQPKSYYASITVNDKVYGASGREAASLVNITLLDNVEIRIIRTGIVHCFV